MSMILTEFASNVITLTHGGTAVRLNLGPTHMFNRGATSWGFKAHAASRATLRVLRGWADLPEPPMLSLQPGEHPGISPGETFPCWMSGLTYGRADRADFRSYAVEVDLLRVDTRSSAS